jgi:hypothetical protein
VPALDEHQRSSLTSAASSGDRRAYSIAASASNEDGALSRPLLVVRCISADPRVARLAQTPGEAALSAMTAPTREGDRRAAGLGDDCLRGEAIDRATGNAARSRCDGPCLRMHASEHDRRCDAAARKQPRSLCPGASNLARDGDADARREGYGDSPYSSPRMNCAPVSSALVSCAVWLLVMSCRVVSAAVSRLSARLASG